MHCASCTDLRMGGRDPKPQAVVMKEGDLEEINANAHKFGQCAMIDTGKVSRVRSRVLA
jgi:hypothetical protein